MHSSTTDVKCQMSGVLYEMWVYISTVTFFSAYRLYVRLRDRKHFKSLNCSLNVTVAHSTYLNEFSHKRKLLSTRLLLKLLSNTPCETSDTPYPIYIWCHMRRRILLVQYSHGALGVFSYLRAPYSHCVL